MHHHTSPRYKSAFQQRSAHAEYEHRNALLWIPSPLLACSACNLSVISAKPINLGKILCSEIRPTSCTEQGEKAPRGLASSPCLPGEVNELDSLDCGAGPISLGPSLNAEIPLN